MTVSKYLRWWKLHSVKSTPTRGVVLCFSISKELSYVNSGNIQQNLKKIENATQSFKGVRFNQLDNILYRLYPLLPFDIYVGIIVPENGHLFL